MSTCKAKSELLLPNKTTQIAHLTLLPVSLCHNTLPFRVHQVRKQFPLSSLLTVLTGGELSLGYLNLEGQLAKLLRLLLVMPTVSLDCYGIDIHGLAAKPIGIAARCPGAKAPLFAGLPS